MPRQDGFAEERGALEEIAGDLEHGADGMQRPASSSPAAVDAGPSTGLVSAFLSKVNHMGAGLVEGLGKGAQDVRESARTYDESDAGAASDLRPGATGH